jgi:hypothetical protein
MGALHGLPQDFRLFLRVDPYEPEVEGFVRDARRGVRVETVGDDTSEALCSWCAHGQGVAEDGDAVQVGRLLERELPLVEPERVRMEAIPLGGARDAQRGLCSRLVAEHGAQRELTGDERHRQRQESRGAHSLGPARG